MPKNTKQKKTTKSTSTKLQDEIVGTAHTPTALVGDTSALEVENKNELQGDVSSVDESGTNDKETTFNLEELKEAHEKLKEEKEHQVFTHDQLLEALYWIHYIFEKATMTMVLIKDTAKAAKEDKPLTGDGIYLATRQLEWDSGNRHVIDTLAQYESMEEGFVTYKANNGVPVYLRICPDDYCISSPDTKLYAHEYFQLPNPIERFEEVYG